MTEHKRGDRRAETARRNDDSDLIDSGAPTPSQQGRSGGVLQSDVATQAAEERVRDPEVSKDVDKSDKIAHGTQMPGDHIQGSSD